MEYTINTRGLKKIYPLARQPCTLAVNGVNFNVCKGEIFSLVGPDGAGKTTTIRMLTGVVRQSSGTISLLGYDIPSQLVEAKKHIGYLSQRFSLYGDLTVDENIDFFAEIHRVKNYAQRKEELLNFTRLAPFRDRLADRLSGGMKQKLALAATLIHAPDVIFLDEPTTGVDPVSRREFWKILASLLRSGITIFMSTPYLDEAERSHRVALMDKGKILVCDTPENVKRLIPYTIMELITDRTRESYNLLRTLGLVKEVQIFGDRLHVAVEHPSQDWAAMSRVLDEKHITVIDRRTIVPSLEDVFISLTTKPNEVSHA
ncbi:MAG: ATP-binding cassette domain-containing protein [Bacteroidota bacterium]